jgi:hypothetical protein
MVYAAAADSLPGISYPGKMDLVAVAFALASTTAAWIAVIDPVVSLSDHASRNAADTRSSDDGFLLASATNPRATDIPPRSDVPSRPLELEIKFQHATALLAQKLAAQSWLHAPPPQPMPSSIVPLPRPRPVEANREPPTAAPAAQSDDRTLLQKLADAFPARITLASLVPSGGGPDLTSLGFDELTAIYDISAHTLYMPNGTKLEAHSGLGRLMDDPQHVGERNVGATPPNVYELKPRERLFHGIQAVRMIPVDSNATLGRSGLLAHSYMLGANGDSNGCVSIKDYDRFLEAFQSGEIKHLVVVASIGDLAAPRSNLQLGCGSCDISRMSVGLGRDSALD